jgi:hypothetical protein
MPETRVEGADAPVPAPLARECGGYGRGPKMRVSIGRKE